jgi:hypothetical protein
LHRKFCIQELLTWETLKPSVITSILQLIYGTENKKTAISTVAIQNFIIFEGTTGY